jgi:hypothetical protein
MASYYFVWGRDSSRRAGLRGYEVRRRNARACAVYSAQEIDGRRVKARSARLGENSAERKAALLKA